MTLIKQSPDNSFLKSVRKVKCFNLVSKEQLDWCISRAKAFQCEGAITEKALSLVAICFSSADRDKGSRARQEDPN